ncbi:lachesin-like [Plodia interpunctella]|uniref:lachesin-like n=1 Tax=Plodia interpunctella TaxID=58824 RepID=UPI0023686817|nr:lachesin-like [Plodia interpunctella]
MSVIIFLISMMLFRLSYAKDEPKFVGPDTNVTVVVGRDAILSCQVQNLQNYKVAWLRVDTQTVLTIGPHVITKNHRVGVTGADPQAWSLTIRDVRMSDGGHYMCQVNTEPMITQTHHLHVAVPPDIVSGSNGEVMVREGDAVSLHCAATGIPYPTITWRREDSTQFKINGQNVMKWSGVWLNLTAVPRDLDGAFLCIATNGVPPSVSKRILLHVLCKPSALVSHKMIGGYLGEPVVLQCNIEANPTPVIYWTHHDGNKLQNGTKYQAVMSSQRYKHVSLLRISNVSRDDIGPYFCNVENSMGNARDDVTLYTLVTTTVKTTTTTARTETTLAEIDTTSVTSVQPYADMVEDPNHYGVDTDNFVVVLSQHQMQNLDISPSS